MTPAMFHILLALAEGPQHGYAIMQDVLAQTDGAVDLGPGTLYRAIRRLVDDGLIQATKSDDGRRLPYRITGAGRKAVRAEAAHLAKSVDWARSVNVLEER